MSHDIAEDIAVETSREVAELIAEAQRKVEYATKQSIASSSRAAALLKSLSLHLDEINLIANGGMEQKNQLSALVVRHSPLSAK